MRSEQNNGWCMFPLEITTRRLHKLKIPKNLVTAYANNQRHLKGVDDAHGTCARDGEPVLDVISMEILPASLE